MKKIVKFYSASEIATVSFRKISCDGNEKAKRRSQGKPVRCEATAHPPRVFAGGLEVGLSSDACFLTAPCSGP